MRELVLLTMLSEHQYFTTEQLRVLFYPSLRSAQQQLRWLATEVRLVNAVAAAGAGRARRHAGAGLLGLALPPVAVPAHRARRRRGGCLPPRRSQSLIRRSWYAAEHVLHLEHRLGTNGFWVELSATSRNLPDQGLWGWVGDDAMRRNYQELGVELAPDGFGRYLAAGREVLFYLEWDEGTEPPQQLRRKAETYLRHHYASPTVAHVLVVLPGATREASVRAALARAARAEPRGSMRLWTTYVGELRERGVLEDVWMGLGEGDDHPRRRLTELPGEPRSSRPVDDCVGKPQWWARRPGGGQGA